MRARRVHEPASLPRLLRVADLWETRVLGIEGMTCDNCVKTLTKALKRVNGVKDVGVDRAVSAARRLRQTLQIEPAIHVAEETGRAIVAALDDVQRNAGNLQSGRSGHAQPRVTHDPAKSFASLLAEFPVNCSDPFFSLS